MLDVSTSRRLRTPTRDPASTFRKNAEAPAARAASCNPGSWLAVIKTIGTAGCRRRITVVAEMRFGAEVAAWGARRRRVLDRLVARTGVMPPFHEVTDAYVDVRTWAVRTGHGLGGKDHEADRWVAAVALAARLPLATEDSIFDGVKGLLRADPESEP